MKELHVSHHLLLCAAPTKSKGTCIGSGKGLASWEKLKQLTKEFCLDSPARVQGIVLRTKADCLRVCERGPILLVWPDGIWYEGVSAERIERIIQEHVIEGRPCREWVIRHTTMNNIQASPDQPIGLDHRK